MTCRLAGLALLLLSGAAAALERIQLDLGTIASPDWRLEGIALVLDWDAAGQTRVALNVAAAAFGEQRVEQLRLVCAAFDLNAEQLDCRDGRLSLRSPQLNADAVPAGFRYRFASGRLSLTVSELPLAQGALSLALERTSAGWELDARLQSCALAGLAQLAAGAGLDMPALQYQGAVSGSVAARGDANGLRGVRWQLETAQAGYSNAAGSQAAEALRLASRGSAVPEAGGWRVETALDARQGMLYADPLYLEFTPERALAVKAGLLWRAGGELQLQSLSFDQAGVARGTASGVFAPGAAQALRRLDLTLEQARLPGFYETWLQPWLTGGVLGALETSGELQGQVTLADGQPRALSLGTQRLSFREKSGLFAVDGLDASLRWDDSPARHVSQLAWEGAAFHRLQLGAAALQLETGARELVMLQPLAVPLLDGRLQVQEFELGLEEGGLRWLLDGMLTPVSMQAFSQALGWPELSGKLSGMVPKVRYAQGELTVGGVLLVQAFDGDTTVRNLRIREPLGLAPRLWADVKIADLDLETLTRTFSFGRIEGRLEGEVKGLYMEAWQPVAFDALFRTPPDDDSRHRISQKAVDNISNLGGAGVGGALSRSFLRVLEDFPYRRLGIRCRLENGICRMGGVAPAQRGYYLVQGTLLPPRLDVVGYSDEVDWQSLVQRLAAVTAPD